MTRKDDSELVEAGYNWSIINKKDGWRDSHEKKERITTADCVVFGACLVLFCITLEIPLVLRYLPTHPLVSDAEDEGIFGLSPSPRRFYCPPDFLPRHSSCSLPARHLEWTDGAYACFIKMR